MAPTEEESRILDPCPNCTTLIDVTAVEPFAEIHCPICGTRMRVRTQFNNFALQKIIGEGGMGTVFEAIDLNLQRPVAVKILKKEYSTDESSIAQLETEARITASISHPHVVRVFSAGRDHGQFYLAMELVGRGTLDQLMNLQSRVAEIQVLDVGMQIADGLRAAAQIGLIHRDVKPGNILFSDAHTAKVVDFGLAILMEDEAKTRGEIWGTPYYVAPEKLNNEPEDFRSDIYSLGGTMFHALSGRPPFEAASASLVALKHLKSQAVSLQAFAPDVSNETAYVINRMLNKDPMERYQSYDELIEHLKYAKTQLLARTAAGVKPKNRVVVESDATKSYAAWITIGLLALMIGLGAYVWAKRATFFPTLQTAAVEKRQAVSPRDSDSAYEEAVQALAKGQTEDAITLFEQFITGAGAQQPRLNWAIYQKGIALTLSGQGDEAGELFGDLQQKGLYSEEANEVRLAGFFVESSRLLKDKKSIPGTTTLAYGNSDFEAMGLLAFAMKDWAMGEFEQAAPLLEKFSIGKLDDEYTWVAAYQPLARKYLDDLKLYQNISSQIATAKSPTQKAAVLLVVRDAAARLQTSGVLPERFQKWDAAITQELKDARRQAEQSANLSAQQTLTSEATQWQELARKVALPMRTFAPETVLSDFQSAPFTNEAILHKKEVLGQRLQWLAELKSKLLSGLQSAKFEAPINSRSGAVIPGKIARANAENVFVKSDYGETTVAWKDLSPKSVIAMAEKLVVDPNPNHKKWLIGVYDTLCGNEAQGKQTLIDTAQNDPSLRDSLAVFFEPAE